MKLSFALALLGAHAAYGQAPSTSPTATALGWYSFEGNSECQDSTGARYSYIGVPAPNPSSIDVVAAATWCNQHYHEPSYVGFNVAHTDTPVAATLWMCLFSDKLPDPKLNYWSPPATNYQTHAGSGEIVQLGPTNTNWHCYKNRFYTSPPTKTPTTASPTRVPTTFSPTAPALSFYTFFGNSECQDSTGARYSYIGVPAPNPGSIDAVAAAAWCSQHKDEPSYVGFNIAHTSIPVETTLWMCLFSDKLPTPKLVYVPTATNYYDHPGSGEIVKIGPTNSNWACYKNKAYNPATASPTTAPMTSAPTTKTMSPTTPGFGDLNFYSFVGNGVCQDSGSASYSYVATSIRGSADNDRAAAWCNQHKDEKNYVGFQVSDTGVAMIITCLFSYPLPSPDLVYVNPAATVYKRTNIGTGEIAKIGPANSAISCFKTIDPLKYYSFVGMGTCRDSRDNHFNHVAGVISGSVDNAKAAEWCNQNWDDSHYVGFQVANTGVSTIITCLFSGNLPSPDPTYVNPTQAGYERNLTGSGEIAMIGPINNNFHCFKNTLYNGVAPATPTMSPTASPLSFYSLVGNGRCEDSSGAHYNAISASLPGAVDNDRAAAWCNQHRDEPSYVGFETSSTGISMLMICQFSDKLPTPDLVYINPPAAHYERNETGSGEITKIGPFSPDIFCFKNKAYNGASSPPTTASPVTPATLAPVTLAPVSAPVTLAPVSSSPTLAPNEGPGQCASGHVCSSPLQCTPFNLDHCVDGCCTNLASKSAKKAKAKSSKTG